jgi:hypothetical protein
MYCNKCGRSIDKDSKFCRYCGMKIEKDEDKKNEESTGNDDTNANTENKLWEKFVEIYDSKDEERKVYEDLSSNEVWELIRRISTNKFEGFIDENKELLNKQPYKVIETLKNVFGWCASGGYWFWMAEALLKDKNLRLPKDIALNHFIEEWQKIIGEEFSKHQNDFTPDLEKSIGIFWEYELNTVLESAETVKDLPNEFVDKLRTALFIQIFWGYFGGLAEARYRK